MNTSSWATIATTPATREPSVRSPSIQFSERLRSGSGRWATLASSAPSPRSPPVRKAHAADVGAGQTGRRAARVDRPHPGAARTARTQAGRHENDANLPGAGQPPLRRAPKQAVLRRTDRLHYLGPCGRDDLGRAG